ncbi:hypothetical protein D3C72_2496050 [compost metagenome]
MTASAHSKRAPAAFISAIAASPVSVATAAMASSTTTTGTPAANSPSTAAFTQ